MKSIHYSLLVAALVLTAQPAHAAGLKPKPGCAKYDPKCLHFRPYKGNTVCPCFTKATVYAICRKYKSMLRKDEELYVEKLYGEWKSRSRVNIGFVCGIMRNIKAWPEYRLHPADRTRSLRRYRWLTFFFYLHPSDSGKSPYGCYVTRSLPTYATWKERGKMKNVETKFLRLSRQQSKACEGELHKVYWGPKF